jgi:hypothetical protein
LIDALVSHMDQLVPAKMEQEGAEETPAREKEFVITDRRGRVFLPRSDFGKRSCRKWSLGTIVFSTFDRRQQ